MARRSTLDLHDHALVLDAGYLEDEQGRLVFLHSPPPHTADVQHLVTRTAERVQAWLARQVQGGDEELDDDDGLGLVHQGVALLGALHPVGDHPSD